MAFRFEDLQVWQRAMDLGEQISRLAKSFPKEELYAEYEILVKMITALKNSI